MKQNLHLKQKQVFLFLLLLLTPISAFSIQRSVKTLTVVQVTTMADTGDGSLRKVIENAQDGDVITFNLPPEQAVVGKWTISLGSVITIGNKNLTISGEGDVILDGDAKYTIFCYEGDNTATLTLQGLTIQNGYGGLESGGAYTIKGNISATNCTFSNNVSNAPVGFRGGGLSTVYGNLFLANCVFSNNRVATGSGGGVSSRNGNIFITNCIFSGNSAEYGSGVYSMEGNVTAINSIFTKNTSKYSVIEASFTYLYHCTVVENVSPGILIRNSCYAYNSIIAGNTVQINGHLTGGDSLIEGINGVTFANIFGTNTVNSAGKIYPLTDGSANGVATALTAGVILVFEDVNKDDVIAALATDLESASRPETFVTYGALETGAKESITYDPAVIIGQSQDASVCLGSSHTFRVVATGSDLRYQWYKGNNLIPGIATAEYTISNVSKSDYANYRVRVYGVGNFVESTPFHLWVADPLPTTMRFAEYPDPAIIGTTYSLKLAGYTDVMKYSWSFSKEGVIFSPETGNAGNNETRATFGSSAVGRGILKATLEHPCGTREVTQEIEVKYLTGMNDVAAEVIKIYPNPTSGILNISGTKAYKTVIVSDITGSSKKTYNTQEGVTTIDLTDLSQGTYILQYNGKSHKIIRK